MPAGGRREGAGRPAKYLVVGLTDEAGEFLRRVMNDEEAPLTARLRAAMILYTRTTVQEAQGKKALQRDAAVGAQDGFGSDEVPKLALVQPGKG